MKSLLSAAVLVSLCASSAFADCTVPDNNVQIPDGSTATKDEMIAAQKAVQAYDAAVKTYTDCLQQEQQAQLDAGGDKVKLQKKYAELNNVQVEKVQQLADKFNTELRAYKSKPAG